MMRALQPEIFNTLYRLIAERIPKPPVHPNGGCRRRIPDRLCFEGIFWRFVTGAAWETVEAQLHHQVSDTTLRARRDEWIAAGVFDQLVAHARDAYDRMIGLDTSHVALDGSDQLAPCGGLGTAVGPAHKGRLGWKWCAAVEATGIPLGWTIDGANRNDYAMLQPTLDVIIANPATARIGTLHLDRGFGYPSLPDRLNGYPIEQLNVAWRNKPNQGRILLAGFGRRRWVIERSHSWLTNYGQLRRNTDRHPHHRHAALCLATTILITHRLIDFRDQHCRPIR